MVFKKDISDEEILYRTKLADCIIKETKSKKDQIELEVKNKNICRIDVALSEFDGLCKLITDSFKGLPDDLQTIIPSMTPEQYKRVQEHLHGILNVFYNRKMHLTLTPLDDERAERRDEKREYMREYRNREND